MHALIIVDIQNDFLPGGSLAVPQADDIIPIANNAMIQAKQQGHLVIATQDFHPANHGSFISQHPTHAIGDLITLDGLPQIIWPDHCVQHTPGADFPNALRTDLFDTIIQKGTNPTVDSYSGFYDNNKRNATGLTDDLRSNNITSLTILGLATDYCVKYTALDAIAEGFKVTLHESACRGEAST